MNKGIKIIRGIIAGGLATVLSFVVSFFLTPYITKILGTEAYGFSTIAKNFVSYATIATTALNSYAARYVTIEYHKKRIDKANVYMSSVFFGDIVLSFAILIVALIVTYFLEYILNIPNELVHDVKILFIVTFINFALSTVETVFPIPFYIKNTIDLYGAINSGGMVVQILTLVITFSQFKPHIWYVPFASLMGTAFSFFCFALFDRKFVPELHINRQQFSFTAIRKLLINGLWNSINSIGNTLNSGLDLLVSNIMLSALASGQLAITKTLSMVFTSFNQIIAQPFQPLFLDSYAKNDKKQLLKDFNYAMKVSGMFSNIFFAGYLAFGLAFLHLWIPNENIKLVNQLMIITMLSVAPEGVIYPLYYIYTLTIKNKVPCYITILGGIANVLGMYILIKYTNVGIYAVPLTTAIVMGIISLITNPLYMAKCLHEKWCVFYPTIIRNIFSCILMCFAFEIINYLVKPQNWLTLIIVAIFSAIIGMLIQSICVFDSNERKTLLRKIKLI
jgi:O-antigen/teichoic acid export membrane protein